VPTDVHLPRAAPATVQPIALLLPRPHSPAARALDSAAICGHKGGANATSCRASAQKARGVLPGMCPGLRLSSVWREA
jgi:hypothetical protein